MKKKIGKMLKLINEISLNSSFKKNLKKAKAKYEKATGVDKKRNGSPSL